ncbi:hypothetical protein GCM10009610_23360 [Pseudonocardia xinjiangensis]
MLVYAKERKEKERTAAEVTARAVADKWTRASVLARGRCNLRWRVDGLWWWGRRRWPQWCASRGSRCGGGVPARPGRRRTGRAAVQVGPRGRSRPGQTHIIIAAWTSWAGRSVCCRRARPLSNERRTVPEYYNSRVAERFASSPKVGFQPSPGTELIGSRE